MPVEFLPDEQAARYGRFAEAPSRADLDRLCLLDDADCRLVARRRGDVSRLGFALQLVTVRSLGTFLTDPLDVPTSVLDFVAEQLGTADPVSARWSSRPWRERSLRGSSESRCSAPGIPGP